MAHGQYTYNFSDLDIDLPTPNNTSSEYNQTVLQYDWGICKLNDLRMFCTTHENMSYAHWFNHVDDPDAGKRRCQIKETTDLTDWRNSICRGETQDLNPTVENENNQIIYIYQ